MIETDAALNSVENPPDPASLGAVLVHLTARLTLFPSSQVPCRERGSSCVTVDCVALGGSGTESDAGKS